jgi:hypothetical protein
MKIDGSFGLQCEDPFLPFADQLFLLIPVRLYCLESFRNDRVIEGGLFRIGGVLP